jgi:hypothetical protein
VSRLVLDAGALIALERNDRDVWAALKLAAIRDAEVVVPTTVLAQVWRGTRSQARLARALAHCVLAPFDPIAGKVGELCGRTRTDDICDAHVAIVTRAADVVYTSDPGDITALLAANGTRAVLIRC